MPSTHAHGHSALRRGRASFDGGIYLVTFATFGRTPHFLDHDMAMRTCQAITDRRLWLHSDLLAWVLMPDHWHGLVRLAEEETLSRLVGRVKANSARLARATQAAPRIWGRAFHDRGLRHDEALIKAVHYIIMNPVRAGLAASPEQYPYWDSAWIAGDRLFKPDPFTQPPR